MNTFLPIVFVISYVASCFLLFEYAARNRRKLEEPLHWKLYCIMLWTFPVCLAILTYLYITDRIARDES